MNPNPNGCGTIQTACCADPLCDGLTATITIEGCDCLDDGTTVPLIATGDPDGEWEGTGALGTCGTDITIRLRCVELPPPAEGNVFMLDVETGTGCLDAEDLESESESCVPALSVQFMIPGGGDTCCDDPMAGFTFITITE